MHYPQLPDEAGWDVNATQPMVLADDFQCTWTGPIKDIHFWGSWKHGVEGQIVSFFLSLHEDIPADQSPTGYSMPGATLWEREVSDFDAIPRDPPTAEGWYDPATGEVIFYDHQAYFQYDVCFNDPADWFYQDSGTIYWLNISAIVADPTTTTWGWKSTLDHWNDDAVWATWGNLSWIDIWEPAEPLEDGFTIQIDPSGVFLGGGSQTAFGNGWYFYPEYEWWNIWFYDHPFAPERRKTGFIDFDLIPTDPGLPSFFEIAVNWSTDLWSLEQPPTDSAPPLPGVNEDVYIGRKSLFAGEVVAGHYTYPFEILDYNPEWVSVDVRGYNYSIPGGYIQHLCQGSLDLAFVITGKEEQPVDSGACCYDPTGLGINAACLYTTQVYCEQTLLGVYEGTGTQCTAQEACCLPDGSCLMADPLCCVNELGGTPQGPGSQCTQPQACCMPDGSCAMLDPLCCDEQGGFVSPYSNVCLGDNNQNGTDDACEAPADSGACCYDPTGGNTDAACIYTTQTYCEQTLGGVYEGTGTQCTAQEACCLPDGSCIMADPLCCTNELGGTPQGAGSACTQTEACCMPDGSCSMLDPLCCADQGGTPQGAGTTCTQAVACCLTDGSCTMVDPLCCDDLGGTVSPYATTCQGDNDQNGIDDACEAATGACCLPDNTCAIMTASACNQLVGNYLGDGTVCLGDNNQNGVDDACERPWQPGDPHKMHFPQLPNPEGWDVWDPTVMADDWMCTGSGPVKDIHFWGSWLNDDVGVILSFEFRIYRDIPAVQSPTGYSVPGELVWTYVTSEFNPVAIAGPPEGWYEPMTQDYFPANHPTYFQYDIYIPEQFWFIQEEGTIYWLAIVANIENPDVVRWGWKSTLDHFNDDAVWGIEPFPTLPDHWREMYEPPDFQISLDLAFVITGGGTVCDCYPGDANNDNTINIGDAVYLINYIFKGGPPPAPYPLCSGDANCDCTINIGDAVYLINYIFKGGPPPCDCLTWLSICGPPLRD